jgi:hypothetical protein
MCRAGSRDYDVEVQIEFAVPKISDAGTRMAIGAALEEFAVIFDNLPRVDGVLTFPRAAST